MSSIAILSKGTLSDLPCASRLNRLEQERDITVHRLPIAPRTPIEEVLQATEQLSGKGIEGVILPNIKPIDDRFLDLIGPKLSLISLPFVGIDGLDPSALKSRNVRVANTAGVNAEETAEHAVALLYAMRRNLLSLDTHVRAGNWKLSGERPLVDLPLGEQSVAILGFGSVGQAILRQLATHRGALSLFVSERFFNGEVTEQQQQALEQVSSIRKIVGLGPVAIAPSAHLRTKMAHIDNLLIAASANSQKSPLLGNDELQKARSGTAIVNIARASLIDEEALIAALNRGVLFATDVFAVEPPDPTDAVVNHSNTCLRTPHVAGAGKHVQQKMLSQALDNLLAGLGIAPEVKVQSYVEL